MNAPRKGRRVQRLTAVCACFELKTVADCVLYRHYLVPRARCDTNMVSKASVLTSSTPVGSQCYKFLYFCNFLAHQIGAVFPFKDASLSRRYPKHPAIKRGNCLFRHSQMPSLAVLVQHDQRHHARPRLFSIMLHYV